MLFTSYKFLCFFIVVFALYWSLWKRCCVQNWVLLLASYIFYGIAEWRMIPLLAIATIIFYWLGIQIQNSKEEKKQNILSWIGITLGLGVLLYFKYFNFFISSFADFFSAIGLHISIHTFNILMPLGVSYFTFKLISYILEVERGKMDAVRNLPIFATYVAFFPTIMAGPIDRPNRFIPQLECKRTFFFELGLDGFQQILWGLFKKVVIADNLSVYVDSIWANMDIASGSSVIVALMFYSVQMYADFSGYSDMAIGISKLLGLQIARNFKYPFFATSITEFWRRWHISLTSWLTDYVFIPLNVKLRNFGQMGVIFAIMINMVLVGMWHGDNWTYAVFGLYQGLLFVPVILSGNMNKKQKLVLNQWGGPRFKDFCKMLGIFLLYTIGTILFRAQNLSQSLFCITRICSIDTYSLNIGLSRQIVYGIFIFLCVIIAEWKYRSKEYVLQPNGNIGVTRFIILDSIIVFMIYYFGNFSFNQFIYFQF